MKQYLEVGNRDRANESNGANESNSDNGGNRADGAINHYIMALTSAGHRCLQ